MNRKQLFKSLNVLCKDLNRRYNINCGGCCFVAACLAEQLEKYNIPFKIITTWHPTHFWIKVSDRCINRDEYFMREATPNDSYNTSESLYSLYLRTAWNDCYETKWNPVVKNEINSLFIEYGNSIRRLRHDPSV